MGDEYDPPPSLRARGSTVNKMVRGTRVEIIRNGRRGATSSKILRAFSPARRRNSETAYVWYAYKRLNIFPRIGRVGCQMLSKRWRMIAAW